MTDSPRDEHELWQAEKMAALGRLAASVAHEIRNPLGAVDIQLQLMREAAVDLDPAVAARFVKRLDIARAEMRRLDGIVQNFLRFSRPPALHLATVSPQGLLERLHSLVEPEARQRRVEFVLEPSENLPTLEADDNVLSQALLNVIINALQAVEEGGQVVLSAERLGESFLRFRVEDDGCGIPEQDLERVLEYYYTTKDTGSGLGLSIAQGIVQQHGGLLQLHSRPGAGTTVDLELPAATT
ncbi:MAG: ATP-binding protein [Candidatus Latescibacterota bacterium]|nr:ATP-binding protein [Candidatus Latescibacterota bacterium]